VQYNKKQAYTDFLTGCENRMAFEHQLRKIGDSAKQGQSVAMIIYDVNNLKTINDTKGHDVGDEYIKNTVKIISEHLSEYGPLYRIGGDEFASLIVGREEIEIERIMHALRTERRMVLDNHPFDCAFGAAFFIRDIDQTMRDVFKRADDAMYEEKRQQKDIAKKVAEAEDSTKEIVIARQPIYDRRMRVFAYELLYRNSVQTNSYNEENRDYATASVLASAFLSRGIENMTDKKMGFINFTNNLLDLECIKSLPAHHLGIEIRDTITPTDESLEICSELSDLGYTLALDDYVIGSASEGFVKYAKIIKVDFINSTDEQIKAVVAKYRSKDIKFIAESIETKETYDKARAYGFDYFQGYYFSRPAVIKSTLISPLHINVLQVLSIMRDEDCAIKNIAEVIKYDPGMVHQLYRLANSVAYGTDKRIDTLSGAIVRIGLNDLRTWMFFMLTHNMYSEKPNELIKQSILRAKAAEEICIQRNLGDSSDFSLLGLFSLLDAIMDSPYETIVNSIPMPERLKRALTRPGKDYYGAVITMMRAYDRADWNGAEQAGMLIDLSLDEYGKIYLDAVKWCDIKCASYSS